jgi:hypothetical protein
MRQVHSLALLVIKEDRYIIPKRITGIRAILHGYVCQFGRVRHALSVNYLKFTINMDFTKDLKLLKPNNIVKIWVGLPNSEYTYENRADVLRQAALTMHILRCDDYEMNAIGYYIAGLPKQVKNMIAKGIVAPKHYQTCVEPQAVLNLAIRRLIEWANDLVVVVIAFGLEAEAKAALAKLSVIDWISPERLGDAWWKVVGQGQYGLLPCDASGGEVAQLARHFNEENYWRHTVPGFYR